MQKELVQEFKRYDAGESGFNLSGYLGTPHKLYHVKNSQERLIAKNFMKQHTDLSPDQFIKLLDLLYSGVSFNERTMGTKLLEYRKEFKALYSPARIYRWLEGLTGWSEIDSLCQCTFSSNDLLAHWDTWKGMLDKMSLASLVSRRRASLVLLVKPVRGSADSRLSETAFMNLERLKGERDILISKAVSWLLRDLIKHHRSEIKAFLDRNKAELPKFVYKEVTNKLIYGTKSKK